MNASELIDAIEDAGYDTMPYAGRGMYGKQCVAFTVERHREMSAVATIVATIMAGVSDQEKREELAAIFSSVNRDNLGRDDDVIYFPRMIHPDTVEPESDTTGKTVSYNMDNAG